MKNKILIADDHWLFRDGLKALLEKQADMQVVGETADGIAAVKAILEKKPDIVLMDISMPELNGIEATRQIMENRPETKVIVLSMHSDQRYIAESLKAGAVGYILKDCPTEELLVAIRAVANKQIYLSRQITESVVRDYINLNKGGSSQVFAILSPREREVLQLLAEGKSTKEIAEKLNVSVKTIETHRKQIMDKLNIRSIAELTKYAIREGLTSL
jgi:DNA-binding NarL/FixJ family response regulator